MALTFYSHRSLAYVKQVYKLCGKFHKHVLGLLQNSIKGASGEIIDTKIVFMTKISGDRSHVNKQK